MLTWLRLELMTWSSCLVWTEGILLSRMAQIPSWELLSGAPGRVLWAELNIPHSEVNGRERGGLWGNARLKIKLWWFHGEPIKFPLHILIKVRKSYLDFQNVLLNFKNKKSLWKVLWGNWNGSSMAIFFNTKGYNLNLIQDRGL